MQRRAAAAANHSLGRTVHVHVAIRRRQRSGGDSPIDEFALTFRRLELGRVEPYKLQQQIRSPERPTKKEKKKAPFSKC
jgi:hypothetical protein